MYLVTRKGCFDSSTSDVSFFLLFLASSRLISSFLKYMYELQIFISQRLRRIPSEISEFFISCEVRDLTDGDNAL